MLWSGVKLCHAYKIEKVNQFIKNQKLVIIWCCSKKEYIQLFILAGIDWNSWLVSNNSFWQMQIYVCMLMHIRTY